MARIYTRTGDSGESGLFDGQRVTKTACIFQAIGDVDEVNSWLGVIRSYELSEAIAKQLKRIQNRLFDLGANLAGYEKHAINSGDVNTLEEWIDNMQKELEPLKQFILPAGGRLSGFIHVARSVCRRAERSTLLAADKNDFPTYCCIYLNRLSDYFFVLARYMSQGNEQFWEMGADL